MNDEKTTDWLDVASNLTEKERSTAVDRIRLAASEIPVGAPGECARCGEYSLRLVNETCAPCRDKFKLT
jgi:hypothetical protein